MKRVRLATRASPLARAQAETIARAIETALGWETEMVPVTTSGDRIRDRPLADIGGKGLFVKEIEQALLDGRADLAVHSAKDLPAALAPGLALVCFPQRGDPRDALVVRNREQSRPEALPRNARVGTGSLRRASQLRAWRPDLVIVPLRGNVGTRLRKLEDDGLDAVVLACAGLDRLGLSARIDARIEPELVLPAVGQGTLALEARQGDAIAEALAVLDHPDTRFTVEAERAFLEGLGGDCNVPLAALAEPVAAERIRLRALVASPDGRRIVRADLEAPREAAAAAGQRAARELLAKGAAAILESLRGRAPA